MCLKLDAIPVGWNGWLSFYDLDENRKEQAQEGIAQARQAAGPSTDPFEDTDLPF
jgi:hypothetical protein